MRTRFIGKGIALAFMLIVATTALTLAQDTSDSPLLALLDYVPDMAGNRGQIMYADRGAIEAAYPGARVPADWAEFIAMNDAEGDDPDLLPVEVWWRIFMNMAVPSSSNLFGGEETEALMGFDYFDIARELSYGTPPEQGLILEGDFDEDAVRAALEARGFAVDRTAEDAEIWCGEAGCDAGNQMNPAARELGNLFGGDLGREQPIFIGNDVLISSPSMEQVLTLYDGVTAGGVRTLSTYPAYQAAVGAVSELGTILQASFLDGDMLFTAMSGMPIIGSEQDAAGFPLDDYVTIAPYELIMVADVVSEEQQIGVAAFVYRDAAQAETAVAEMARRLQTLNSQRTHQSFADMLKGRRASIETQVVERDGLAVALVLLSTPKATAEQIVLLTVTTPAEELPPVTAPGLVYRMLLNGVFSRDDLWYSTVPREIVEELLAE